MEAGGWWFGGQPQQHSKTPSQKYRNDFASRSTDALSLQLSDMERHSKILSRYGSSISNQPASKTMSQWTSALYKLPTLLQQRPTQRERVCDGASGGGGLALELRDAMAGWRKDQLRQQSAKMPTMQAWEGGWQREKLLRDCLAKGTVITFFVLNSSLWLQSSKMTDMDHLDMHGILKKIRVGTRLQG